MARCYAHIVTRVGAFNTDNVFRVEKENKKASGDRREIKIGISTFNLTVWVPHVGSYCDPATRHVVDQSVGRRQ